MCGALTIKDMHQAEMIIAPSIKTEGKVFQMQQKANLPELTIPLRHSRLRLGIQRVGGPLVLSQMEHPPVEDPPRREALEV